MPGRTPGSPYDPFEDPFGATPDADDESDPEGWDFLTEDPPTSYEPPPETGRSPRTKLRLVALALVVLLAGTVAYAVITRQERDESSASTDRPAAPRPDSAPSEAPRSPSPRASASPVTPPLPSAAPARTAASALATLAVKGRAPADYDRDQFGSPWADVDRNGCDTRNDILVRDLDRIEFSPDSEGCEVASGVLADPYSGRTLHFVRGWETSIEVQIDHVVALSNSWQTGSQYWRPGKRLRFANDPLNLLAVDGGLNMQKGAADAATWLPPSKRYRCAYVARQVAVKAKYELWLTPPEKAAITRVLASCPAQPLPRAG